MDLKKHILDTYIDLDPSSEGFSVSLGKLVDYAVYVYVKGDKVDIRLNEKKEAGMAAAGIKRDSDKEMLLSNKSRIVSKIITEILRTTADREFELYISALEAATILLDVVRRPIDEGLDEDKWFAALKAKKQGFNDARDLLESASEISEKMIGAKETDLEEHVEDNVFKRGNAEKLAEKALKK